MAVKLNFTISETLKESFYEIVELDPIFSTPAECLRFLIQKYVETKMEEIKIIRQTAKSKLTSYPPGSIVESKELLEPIWETYSDPEKRLLGKQFKQDVDNNIYPNLRFKEIGTNHHAKYEVI